MDGDDRQERQLRLKAFRRVEDNDFLLVLKVKFFEESRHGNYGIQFGDKFCKICVGSLRFVVSHPFRDDAGKDGARGFSAQKWK
jgi:hypothetical protein